MAGKEGAPKRRGLLGWLGRQPLFDRAMRLLSASVLYSALDDRLELREAVQAALKKPVPSYGLRQTFCLGGMAIFCLVNQIVTGILLAIYYQPSPEGAYDSVVYLTNEVPFGWLVRQLHAWGAHLMMAFVLFHMVKVFWTKAYRPPRELTWLTGLGLFGLVLFFSFSGYLLPWDDLSFFATRVGITEMQKAPLLGPWMTGLLRGGADVTVDTIGRFYVFHVTLLPLLVIALLGVHLLFIQLQGVSEPDHFAALPSGKKRYRSFFAEFVVAEIPIWLFLSGGVIALAAMLPRGLAPEADVTAAAPAGIKPEWYFLAPYQALKLFPGRLELVGMALMGLAAASLPAVPFIDRAVPSDARGKLVAWLGAAGLVGLVVMTVWGWLS
jgi:cytochrome b6